MFSGATGGASLAEAVASNSLASVKQLIEQGIDINSAGAGQLCSRTALTLLTKSLSFSDGTTPLCAAALWGNDIMVAFLLDNGANIHATNAGLCPQILAHTKPN
jgi:ankyrin repeat protein